MKELLLSYLKSERGHVYEYIEVKYYSIVEHHCFVKFWVDENHNLVVLDRVSLWDLLAFVHTNLQDDISKSFPYPPK